MERSNARDSVACGCGTTIIIEGPGRRSVQVGRGIRLMSTIDSSLLHELPLFAADRKPAAGALTHREDSIDYAELARGILAFSAAMLELGLRRGERVGIYLDKRFETVISSFGATAAGGAFVPLNPLLKPEQVG